MIHQGSFNFAFLFERIKNLQKVAKDMFPDCKDYLGVYEDAGLLGPRSLLAHSIFTTDDEYKRMASTGTSGKHFRFDL